MTRLMPDTALFSRVELRAIMRRHGAKASDRRHRVRGIGFGPVHGPSQGFSQNPPDARAETPAAVPQNSPDARVETQAAIAKYCTTCHNERLRTAGLALDPTGVARPGDQSETWEKVLRQLRAGTMPPPGAARPPQAFYTRAAGLPGARARGQRRGAPESRLTAAGAPPDTDRVRQRDPRSARAAGSAQGARLHHAAAGRQREQRLRQSG